MMDKIKNIRISEKTKKRLDEFGKFGESYEDVIKRLMEICREKK